PPGAARPGHDARIRVAALIDYYLPGYKAGGALRTVGHMAAQLADALDFHVISRDRDMLDTAAYSGLVPGAWSAVAGTPVRYLAPGERGAAAVARALREARPDVVYLNSAFSPVFTLQPLAWRALGRLPRVPVVVAPRGELSEGALSLKRAKKVAFLRLARATGLYRGVLWQASSSVEADEVRQWFGTDARVLVAPDLREQVDAAPARLPAPKRAGELRAVFLSRISGKKNLAGALRMLAGLRGDVSLTVYGPVDDPAHWAECQAVMAGLPANVRVEHAGPLRPEQVNEALAAHHLFLFPTLGENFGHVVLEALLAGLPVLTSDRTPWGGLEAAGAGWALPLEPPERFVSILQAYVDAAGDEHARRSAAARAFGEAAARDASVLEANLALFRRAVRDAAR
ncbi:glycosyltransferase, partial [Longimicrobium sp.]|uniref:glycosyltransferase n=1 Tax=Longimicrobium sp. TaxID=2029185 RepID=UPI002E31B563